MTPPVHHVRPAMATLFEVVLLGEQDEEHLAAVAEAALDEITRIDHLLSRHDPRSEVSRLNREAAAGEVLVDRELFELLQVCGTSTECTEGYFDVAAALGESTIDHCSFADVRLDAQRRTIGFGKPALKLDFGALGKGYALDRAAEIARSFGVERALLHGGTSSILALGVGPHDRPWNVGIRNPADAGAPEVAQISLMDQGYSCSAAFSTAESTSDIIDPHLQRPLARQAACAVIAPTALEAEILSTALLAMGLARARAYTEKAGLRISVGWFEAANDPAWSWLRGPG